MYGMEYRKLRSVMSSNAVTFMQKRNAENVSQDSIAVADVQQTLTISMEIFWMPMILGELQRKRVECAIMIKAAEAEE